MPNIDITRIDSILEGYIKDSGLNKKVIEAEAVHIYNSIKDEDIYYHTKAYKVVDNELYIKVESPLYANQISLRSTEIIYHINKKVQKRLINRLRFKLGEVGRETNLHEPIKYSKVLLLTTSEENQIVSSLSGFTDKWLSSKLQRVFKLILKTRNRRVE